MPAVRTTAGAVADKSTLPATTTWTPISSITLAAGETLIVGVAFVDTVATSVLSATWNGVAMTADIPTFGVATNQWDTCFSLKSAGGGTGNLVLTITGSGLNWSAFNAAAVIAIKVTGLTDTPFDQSATGGANNTVQATGTSGTLTQADEFLFAISHLNGPTAEGPPTWTGDPNTAGQNASTTGAGATSNISISEAYLNPTTTTAGKTATATWLTARNGGVFLATYKITAVPFISEPPKIVSQAIARSAGY